MRRFMIIAGAICLVAAGALRAADREELRFFETKIRPLLAEHCFECHGEEKKKAGLRLDHISFIEAGGESGPALLAGKPDESLLVEAIRRTDPDFSMPPKKALSKQQVSLLEQWVRMGAPWPAEAVAAGESDEHGFTKEDRAWWAVKPVKRPPVPRAGTDASGWPKNEIDRFVLRRLRKAGLEPSKPAGPRELIRRMHFDLHGLPPAPADVERFAAEFAEDEDAAVSREVDRLLDSPRYGERWAQHWLDVVRYAESDGYRADDFRPGTWKFRDYVIRSLNEDKPYDRFVREQLAADEFAADDPDSLIATAFLRLGIYEWNQRNARMQWDLIMTEMTNVTAEAFLGLGIGCAQCHDHKFDPILQRDHFALRAFLSTTWWPENASMATPEERAEYEAKRAEWERATREIREQIRQIQQPKLDGDREATVKQFPGDVQEIYRKPAGERTAYEEQLAQLVQRQVDNKWRKIDWKKELAKRKDQSLQRYEELNAQLAGFDHLKPADLPLGFISTDVKREPAETLLATRNGKEKVEPAFLTLLDLPEPEIVPTAGTTGRRLALADWIASRNNPLSTRVIVNRVWHHHFKAGIVPTPNDFGTLGEEPSHPELLDWLTSEFLDGGWKLKPLHRLVMNSAAYRQTSRREPGEKEATTDPGNRWLWRFPPSRLGAEQIRDAMLAVTGELGDYSEGPSKPGTEKVRSVFVKKMRNTPDSIMGTFDAPAGFDSAPSRLQTTTPTQSLLMVNADWPLERSRALAIRLLRGKKAAGPAEIESAYRLVYGRAPEDEEIRSSLEFLESQRGETPARPAEPRDKFPGETGLRPIGQHFSSIEKNLGLGESALWLQPGSRFERLEAAAAPVSDDSFTIEAVAQLDGIHRDASVNTLVSRWNGNQKTGGWTFGVTSEKSRYQPRNFILQLIGKNVGGDVLYEVVASDLRVPTGKPVYLAAAISTDSQGKGFADFFLKDLSDPSSPLQTSRVEHDICGEIQTPGVRTLVGGRDQKGHLWDGQLARLTVSPGVLERSQLLVSGEASAAPPARLVDWVFAGNDEETPAPESAWIRNPKPDAPSHGIEPALLGAMTDFCHALLNSNEFLYLH